VAELAKALQHGDRRALARALSLVEAQGDDADRLLEALPPAGTAHRIGVTGPPGAGKSTLVAALTGSFRENDREVGVLAIDPSSPFSGGALLGDRVRMLGHAGDPSVFVRSFASRGALGGLAPATHEAADVLEAGGFDPLLIETVGVGQAEIAVCEAADTTVVVLAPGSGDEVQGMKAGLLEVADCLVVNQADRPGASALEEALEAALDLRTSGRARPPVFTTVATEGRGVDGLRAWLDLRAQARDDTGSGLEVRRRARIAMRLRARVEAALARQFWQAHGERLESQIDAVARGAISLRGAAAALIEESMP